jgi:hypothetical protein
MELSAELSSEDGAWYASSPSFFLPVKALSRLFRGKFRALIRKAALLDQIPSETWQQDWNVNCQAVPNAEASIQYLAPYVFKVAISDHRILKVEKTSVSFSYKKPGSARRFLQHVLPKGFMKVRYYGFFSPTANVPLEDIKALVELAHGFTVTVPEIKPPPWPQPICRACGGRLRFHSTVRTHRSTRPLPMSAGPPGLTASEQMDKP